MNVTIVCFSVLRTFGLIFGHVVCSASLIRDYYGLDGTPRRSVNPMIEICVKIMAGGAHDAERFRYGLPTH